MNTAPQVQKHHKSEYNTDPTNVKSVYLLGHIAVPSVGNFYGDGHVDYQGRMRAASTDTYYGEMTQEFNKLSNGCSPYQAVNNPSGIYASDSYNTLTQWNIPFRTTSGNTDYLSYSTPGTTSSYFDVPPLADKFCFPTNSRQTPTPVELQVGRVDMYELMNHAEFSAISNPTFTANHVQTVEKGFLSDYLTKAHNFKVNQWAPTKRAFSRDLVQDMWGGTYEGGKSIWGTFPSLVGPNNMIWDVSNVNTNPFNNKLAGDQTYLFFSAFSGGGSSAADDNNGKTIGHSRIMANTESYEHGGVFNIFIASLLWEIADANPLLRMALTSGKPLATMYGLPQNWFLHSMGLGKDIGYAGKMSINNTNSLYANHNKKVIMEQMDSCHF